ncbi:MAG: hypothetical protein PHN39_00440 [Candidatus Pacebacteria bacterium]|nr:hypothetical protein [Candidatus Paceibacterota bacterium]
MLGIDWRQNTTLVLFCIVAVLAAALIYLLPRLPRESRAQAQSFTDITPDLSGDIVCDEVIPIGSAFDHTKALMDDIYQEYKNAQSQLDLSVANLTSQIASLTSPSDAKQVCDFSACNPPVDPVTKQVRNPGAPLALNFNSMFAGNFNLLSWTIPSCAQTQCVGSPCADLTLRIEELKNLKETFQKMQERVHSALYEKVEPIGYDYLSSNGREKATDKITRPDKIEREIELARGWLTPAIGQRRSCAMTAIDQKRADDGEGGMWGPALCREARESNMYWPRPWSEKCDQKCTDDANPSKECKDCLADSQSKGGTFSGIPNLDFFKGSMSFLATINYQIYGMCPNVCKNELDEKCVDCLCKVGTRKNDYTQEECLAWLCGGSADNWVCCRETGVSRWQTPNDFANMEFYFPTLTGTMRERARDVYKIINEIKAANPTVSIVNLDAAFTLGIIAKETRISEYLGVTLSEVKSIKNKDREALTTITKELNLDMDKVLISRGTDTQSGGAMGPMQIMPSTWLDVRQQASDAKLTVLNPWVLKDSLMGAMLYLVKPCGALDNEETAAKKYFKGPYSKDLDAADAKEYGGSVMAYRKCFAKIIDLGCFEDEDKQNADTKKICNDASLKEIDECKGIVK